jgi:hypothetical protein
MRTCAIAVILLAGCSSPPARAVQESRPGPDAGPGPQAAFLPADYHGELFIDWARMREIELLDLVLRVPAIEPYFEALAREQGSDFDHQERARTVFLHVGPVARTISVVQLAPGALRSPAQERWSPVRIGGYEGFSYGSRSHERAMFWPAPDLAVSGNLALLQDIVAGRHPTGGPHPELAPMLAGDGVLAQVVYGRFGQAYDEATHPLHGWLGDSDDPVDFMRLRLHEDRRGDLACSVTFRFQNGTSGLRATEALARERLEEMRKDRRFARFRQLLDAVAVGHTERDLTASLRLGTPREAVAAVESAVIALIAMMQDRAR